MGKQVQDVMTANPVTVSRTDTVIAAARLMESADVGSVFRLVLPLARRTTVAPRDVA